ncbi:hypothetical protein C8R45DRAFT_1100697 [Mycena sanguinolenta]|nr:hypothetical protein C8R45DRAFT_1100697 [Mycena sanguinolenta]
MANSKTLAALSQPRNHAQTQPYAPLTGAERQEKQRAAAETKAEMDAACAEVHTYLRNKALELAERFQKKERYFLDIFYQAGARMVNAQEKTNPYNAFKSEKAAQLQGRTLKAPELHTEFHHEYEAMTAEEKAAMVKRYDEEHKDEVQKMRRDTPMARIRDFSNTVKNIEQLMHGLSYRVGVEGFYCLVQNSTDFHMSPQWYFTSPELARYLPIAVGRKWDTATVGLKLEAFAIAGCDTMGMLRNTPQKVLYLKAEIREFILAGLAQTVGRSLDMEYVHYEECIVLRYGVMLIGWTADKFANPSELSSSLIVLTTLRDALKNGECKWVKLSREERRERQAKWNAGVADGTITPKSRKQRSDAAQPRKRKHADMDATDDDSDHDKPMDAGSESVSLDKSTADSNTQNAPIITSPPASPAPPAKRRRTAAYKAPKNARQGNKENQIAKSARKAGKVLKDFQARNLRRRATTRPIITSDDEDDGAAVSVSMASGTSPDLLVPTTTTASSMSACVDPSLLNIDPALIMISYPAVST